MDDNYSKLVDIAYKMHISGKFSDAQNVYEKLLSVRPDDINVLNLYAQLNVALKNYDKALEIFTFLYDKTKLDDIQLNIAKVYMYKNDYISAVNSLNLIVNNDISILRLKASAYMKLKNNKEAVKIYELIADSKKPSFDDLYNLSILYSYEKENDKALKWALEAYNLNNNDIDVNLHLASLYEQSSELQNALKHLLNISKIKADKDIMYRIGVIYKQLNDDDSAVKYFNEILNIEPDNKNALLNIASIYKRHDKNVTVKILKELMEKYPEDINIIMSLYITYDNMMNYKECLVLSRRLIELQPEEVFNYIMAADTLYELYNYNEALEMYKKVKNFPDILQYEYYIDYKIATIYSITGKIQEALDVLSKYLSLEYTAKELYMFIQLREKNIASVKEIFYDYISSIREESAIDNMAMRLFYKLNISKKYQISEDLFSLFKNNANRFMTNSRREKYSGKSWKTYNGDVKGKRVLIYNQHGAGDLLMFSRYIKNVQSFASEVILQVAPSFVDLFKYNFPDCKVYSNKDNIDENLYDITTNYMSLLYHLNIDLHNIDGSKYINIDENLVKEKAALDIMHTKKKKAGIYWQGNPTILTNRSIKLDKMSPLFELDNVQIYSFQISTVDLESNDLKQQLPLIDLAKYIKNYSDTAAFLKNIDVLISIDTSIVNLAGAMGIKTFLLLPFNTEWRWFYDTETTPWYNSVKIFKQTIPGDWDEVILRVKNELKL